MFESPQNKIDALEDLQKWFVREVANSKSDKIDFSNIYSSWKQGKQSEVFSEERLKLKKLFSKPKAEEREKTKKTKTEVELEQVEKLINNAPACR